MSNKINGKQNVDLQDCQTRIRALEKDLSDANRNHENTINTLKTDHDQIIEKLHEQIDKVKQHNRQLQAHIAKIEEQEEETNVATTACMVTMISIS